MVKDVIGREWQLGTVQVDYNLPERFDLSYIGSDNQKHRPVMIHRAPFGSMERFCGILIEHFAGDFPTWLAPEQVRIMTLNDDLLPHAREVAAELKKHRIRVGIDEHSDKLGAKVRRAEVDKVPHMIVLGAKEKEVGHVAVRSRADKELEGTYPLEEFITRLNADIKGRKLPVKVEAPAAEAKPAQPKPQQPQRVKTPYVRPDAPAAPDAAPQA